MDFSIGTATFDTDGALATGRQAVVDTDRRGDTVFESQPDQAGRCEDDRVVLAGIELGQAGIDVAAQKADFQIGTARQQLRLTTQAGGADDTAGEQCIQA